MPANFHITVNHFQMSVIKIHKTAKSSCHQQGMSSLPCHVGITHMVQNNGIPQLELLLPKCSSSPTLQLSVFEVISFGTLNRLYLPHSASSDPSLQLGVPSHLWLLGMQPLSWQANWLLEQLDAATDTENT